jgi:hypothetical protein
MGEALALEGAMSLWLTGLYILELNEVTWPFDDRTDHSDENSSIDGWTCRLATEVVGW